MTFTSLSFVILMAIFFPLYALTRGFQRQMVILLTSVIFYGWWDWRFLFLIFTTITVDYIAALRIHATENQRLRNFWLCFSLVINLGILFFFKYFNFFIDSLVNALNVFNVSLPVEPLQIILPVGISFYTFKSLSYTIDVYWRTLEPERSYLSYATVVMFFPELVAGPIVRADYLIPQLRVDHQLKWDAFLSGMQLIVWGFFMKLVVADSLARVVDSHFEAPETYSSLGLALAVVFYAFQIYGDFSGYSLIAIGLGEILGIDLGKNFNRPYISQSFSEFWQRWHISLSTWLRDYLYIPLGGNRNGTYKTYRNLMLTMLIGGFWHGASWNFLIWGGLHGLFLVGQRLIAPYYKMAVQKWRIPAWFSTPVSITFVFSLTCLTWIFFRSQTLSGALYIIQRIVIPDGLGFEAVRLKFEIVKAGLIVAFVILCEVLTERLELRPMLRRYPLTMVPAGAFTIWLIALLGTFGGSAFIYFQF